MWIKLHLGLASIVAGLLGALGIVPALLSVMMFDAPGATENPATIALFLAVASFPIVCCCAIVGAWTFYAAGLKELACMVIWIPVLNVVVGGIAIYCLYAFFGGSFGG